MTRTTVYIEDETMHSLQRISRARSRPQSEIIRDALRRYVRQAEKSISRPLPPGVGKYRSGRSDVSEKAEEILRRAARKRK
ncbi:MAG TPA: ribbon-helix-helix domain-containing protein [Bryobacterales bacterium]|nr:ribbon-helix-helix domain-containing protein [Bryobacterales bacterium]